MSLYIDNILNLSDDEFFEAVRAIFCIDTLHTLLNRLNTPASDSLNLHLMTLMDQLLVISYLTCSTSEEKRKLCLKVAQSIEDRILAEVSVDSEEYKFLYDACRAMHERKRQIAAKIGLSIFEPAA